MKIEVFQLVKQEFLSSSGEGFQGEAEGLEEEEEDEEEAGIGGILNSEQEWL